MSSLVAEAASTSSGSSLLLFAMPVLLIGFMFMSGRRRTKATQKLQSSLSVGDEVSTTSGLLGRITEIDDAIATLEVSPGVTIRFNRRAIAGPAPTAPVSPTDPVSSESETDTESDPTRITK
jgi:preprotein translocase subunit YajC